MAAQLWTSPSEHLKASVIAQTQIEVGILPRQNNSVTMVQILSREKVPNRRFIPESINLRFLPA